MFQGALLPRPSISPSVAFFLLAFGSLLYSSNAEPSGEVRWLLERDDESLSDSFAPSGVRFLGDSLIALEEEGYSPAIEKYFDLSTGNLVNESLFGMELEAVVDFSEESGWAVVYETFGRLALLDTKKGDPNDLEFFSGISVANEVGLFGNGTLVYGISKHPLSGSLVVSVARYEGMWTSVFTKHFTGSSRVEFSEDRSSFVVFQVDESEGVFTKLERYSATSGRLLSSLDLSVFEIEPKISSSVKSSASGRYTVIIPSGASVYLIIDSVEELGAIRADLQEYPRVIGFNGDGTRYAIAHGRRISIYDTNSGEALFERDVPIESLVYAGFDFSASDDRVLLGQREGDVLLVDFENDTQRLLTTGMSDLSLIRFSPQGDKAVIGTPAGKYSILDIAGHKRNVALSEERARWSYFDQEGSKVFVFKESGRLYEHASDSLEKLAERASTHSTLGEMLGMSGSSMRLLSSRDGALDVRGVGDHQPLWQSTVSSVQSITLSRDGSRVAYVPFVDFGEPTKLCIYGVDTNQLLREIDLEVPFATRILFEEDGGAVWVAENTSGLSYRLSLYDVSTGTRMVQTEAFHGFADFCVNRGSGVFVATSSSVLHFDRSTGAQIAEVGFQQTTDMPMHLRLTPDGSKLAFSTRGHRLLVFDMSESCLLFETSLQAKPISGLQESYSDFAFLNDAGDMLVSWWTGKVEVVRMSEGRLIRPRLSLERSRLVLSFDTVAGARYEVESSPSLRDWSMDDAVSGGSSDSGKHSEEVQLDDDGVPRFLRVWEYR